jgi:hypothetical protein
MNIRVWKKGLELFAWTLVFAGSLGAMDDRAWPGVCCEESYDAEASEALAIVRLRTVIEGVTCLEGLCLNSDQILKPLGGLERIIAAIETSNNITGTLEELFEEIIIMVVKTGCKNPSVYQYFVRSGLKINGYGGMQTPLGTAVSEADISVTKALVEACANPDAACFRCWQVKGNVAGTTPRKMVEGLISSTRDEPLKQYYLKIKEIFDSIPGEFSEPNRKCCILL